MVRPLSNNPSTSSKIRKFGDSTNIDNQIIVLAGLAWIPGQPGPTTNDSFIIKQINDGLYIIEEEVTGIRGKCKLSLFNNMSVVQGEMYIPINGVITPSTVDGGHIVHVQLSEWGNNDYRIYDSLTVTDTTSSGSGATILIGDIYGSLNFDLGITIANGGSGYHNGGTVTEVFSHTPISGVLNPGFQATIQSLPVSSQGQLYSYGEPFNINLNFVNGVLDSVSLDSPSDGGSGWRMNELREVVQPILDSFLNNGANGPIPTVNASLVFDGQPILVGRPINFDIQNRGNRYSQFLTTITGGSGSGAIFTPHITPVALFNNIVDYTINNSGKNFSPTDIMNGVGTGTGESIQVWDIFNAGFGTGGILGSATELPLNNTGNPPDPLQPTIGPFTPDENVYIQLPSLNSSIDTLTLMAAIQINSTGFVECMGLGLFGGSQGNDWILYEWLNLMIPEFVTMLETATGVSNSGVIINTDQDILASMLDGSIASLRFNNHGGVNWTNPTTIEPRPNDPGGLDDIDAILADGTIVADSWAKKILTHRVTGFDTSVYKWNNINPVLNNGTEFFITDENMIIGKIDQE